MQCATRASGHIPNAVLLYVKRDLHSSQKRRDVPCLLKYMRGTEEISGADLSVSSPAKKSVRVYVGLCRRVCMC